MSKAAAGTLVPFSKGFQVFAVHTTRVICQTPFPGIFYSRGIKLIQSHEPDEVRRASLQAGSDPQASPMHQSKHAGSIMQHVPQTSFVCYKAGMRWHQSGAHSWKKHREHATCGILPDKACALALVRKATSCEPWSKCAGPVQQGAACSSCPGSDPCYMQRVNWVQPHILGACTTLVWGLCDT